MLSKNNELVYDYTPQSNSISSKWEKTEMLHSIVTKETNNYLVKFNNFDPNIFISNPNILSSYFNLIWNIFIF